ncbi:flavin-dependent dehydrogenase [Desulfohalotomaculum tongense]|uniref:FAD-dependent oxidoreductase n=1 Tax=Desulforadius tongensis TaxID=1216062 RepID=UPI0019575EF6|nr:FAD-dependent oxidoreductase [Desulforadius tongensis]MBM7853696.1 flavin-dependent dehydrogenase [Desulforadius tongensis]
MKRYLIVLLIMLLGFGMFYLTDRPEPKFFAAKPPEKPPAALSEYDLIVVGSDPEGIAAAVSGARNGLNTLLVDTRPVLGGLMTRGWLNSIDMNYAPNGDILNKGIFLEFYKQVEGDSFDVNTALNVFNRMVENEDNLSVLLDVKEIKPVMNAGKTAVTGIKVVEKDNTVRKIDGRVVIDATQDADIAAAAGVPYSIALSDMGYTDRYVAVTLVFQLKGVSALDWLKMGFSLASNRASGERAGINMVSAWGFGDIMAEYRSSSEQVGIRGLNIGRQKDGTLLVNALHVYGINPLDEQQLQEARRVAEGELPRVVQFLRQNIPGLEHAQLAAAAPELYVRESRHIYGEYRLTVDDVLENRDFADGIAFGSYPIDIQAVSREFKGAVVGVPKQYAIPLRCLVPQKVDGLLVVGRSASFDSLAHGSARVIPVGMATGQAAGAAAALSLEKNTSLRDMCYNRELITQLRERLNRQGMEIKPFSYPVPEAGHWAYEGLKFVRRYGLVFGGYSNRYNLDEEMPEQNFINLLSWITRLAGRDSAEKPVLYTEGNALTIEDVSYMITQYQGKQLTKKEAYRYLRGLNFFDRQVLKNVENHGGKITRGAAYMILKHYIEAGEVLSGDSKTNCS